MPSVPPAGTSPASAYTILSYAPPDPPPAILADKVDPATGEVDLLESADLADAFAIEALRIQRGTGAAARDLGNRYREISHVDDEGIEQIDSMTREAFQAAEEAGVARVVRISREADEGDPTELNTFIEYRSLLDPPNAPTRRLVFRG
jgi:hypothetical protein